MVGKGFQELMQLLSSIEGLPEADKEKAYYILNNSIVLHEKIELLFYQARLDKVEQFNKTMVQIEKIINP